MSGRVASNVRSAVGTLALLILAGGVAGLISKKLDIPRWEAGALTLALLLVVFGLIALVRKRRESGRGHSAARTDIGEKP
jgi:hypothetical protein